MSMMIDFILIALIILGVLAGMKKGLIKSAVSVIGLVTIVIISYFLRTPIAEFMIDKLPFFNFKGFEGLTSINILVYNVIAFILVFVLLYCLLNIIIALTKFVDTLLKLTVIWIIPSKIGGAILGFIETWVFLFLILFALGSFNVTAPYVMDSKVANVIIDHTPIIGNYLSGVTKSAKDIYKGIEEMRNDETKTVQDLNLYILQVEISHGLISKEKAQELIDIDKLMVGNVRFGMGDIKWLNI